MSADPNLDSEINYQTESEFRINDGTKERFMGARSRRQLQNSRMVFSQSRRAGLLIERGDFQIYDGKVITNLFIKAIIMKLSDNEQETLRESEYFVGKPWNGVRTAGGYEGWFTPLLIGGSSRSHHSYTLKKLIKKGLIETIQRHNFSMLRGSRIYRITESGRQYVRELSK